MEGKQDDVVALADRLARRSQSRLTGEDEDEVEEEDHYRMDPFLVRRESTLLLLVLRSFRERVIIFCNEKK